MPSATHLHSRRPPPSPAPGCQTTEQWQQWEGAAPGTENQGLGCRLQLWELGAEKAKVKTQFAYWLECSLKYEGRADFDLCGIRLSLGGLHSFQLNSFWFSAAMEMRICSPEPTLLILLQMEKFTLHFHCPHREMASGVDAEIM